MRRFLSRFRRDEDGATAIEYGLIIALIFLAIVSALTAFGNATSGMFNSAMNALRAAMGG
ncbi:MAG: Flp family type IVb pilin [Brevundimonas sp.]|jgi:pilus assembly protein Flp/PilA|uniref:Flp family type IVb pilin n=1 Tax=Brevundimonas sp. TaxID=1871086 RepID=UPI0017DECFA3|nr:Flp family type IVb pilin [Brevundimonas sp.]MBA4803492.1 Flp family type IVb pilin [Brevundimonas sp.]